MKRQKNTKKALFSSLLSLFICVTMLIGTTFAWFTDNVTSANNIIKSGNLDIELEYWNGTKWADVKDQSDILTNTLWEPGVTEVAYLRVANAGSLALKYQLGINIQSETTGKNQAGAEFKLSDYIMFGVVEDVNGQIGAYSEDSAGRDAAIADVTEAKKISAGYTKSSAMEADDELYLALVVYMPTTVGNDANHDGQNIPEINLGINVYATQYTSEEDSFGSDYDKGAPWTGMVDIDWYLENPDASEFTLTTGEELAGLAAIVNGTATTSATTYALRSSTNIQDSFKGQMIKLGDNINLNESAWTPIGRIGTTSTDFTYSFKGTFDGQEYTVANLNVSNTGWAGLFGIAHGATIKNVSVDGVAIRSNRMAGAVVGQIYGNVENCHVKDAIIMVTPNVVNDGYDNGDKVGGIVGWLGDNGENRTLINCLHRSVNIKSCHSDGIINRWSTVD